MPSYNAMGSGMGHPDARVGHGYGSTNDTPGNKTYPMRAGYPYDLPEDEPDQDADDLSDEEFDVVFRIDNRTLGAYTANDRLGLHVRDRRAYQGQDSLGIPGFISSESLIRLRKKTSEPSIGTMYGWASAPQWREPRVYAGASKPRYTDIVSRDEEDEFDDELAAFDRDRVEEAILRGYVSATLKRHVFHRRKDV